MIEGMAIYDELRNYKGKVITRALGQAASIASIIFMAGDEREVGDNAEIMIHNAMVFAGGNKHELSDFVEKLDNIDQKLINIYASRTNLNEDQVRELLDKETFMDADEAVNKGFATTKASSLALVAMYNHIEQENKEPVKMAENKNEEVEVKNEASEDIKKGFIAHMMEYFNKEEPKAMEEEKPEDMEEEEKEPEAMEEEPEEEAKAEEEKEDSEIEDLKAKIQDLENQLAEAEAKAEEEPQAVKEEAQTVAGLILDAMSDDKITMHEAKNLCSDSLEDVKAILDKKESNATGRGKAESPKDEAPENVYDQYKAIEDPAERKAFFNENREEIINQSKES